MTTNAQIAEYLLDELKKAGATGAQCVVSRGKTDELNVDGGDFSLMRTLWDTGVSMKALVDGRKGVAATNRLDRAALDEAVAACLAGARAATPDEAEMIAPSQGTQSFTGGPQAGDMDRLFDRVQEFMETVKARYPKVIATQLIAKHSLADSLYANSNGSRLSNLQGAYSFASDFSAKDGDRASSFNGYDFVTDRLDTPFAGVGMMGTLLAESERQIDTRPVQGKFEGTLLVTPAGLPDILGAALGGAVTDGVLIDGTSVYKDKLGQPVADAGITLSSSPLAPFVVGGERITPDGYISENYDIIKNGVLKSFMLGQYGARKTGNARAANGAFNLEMAAGDKTLAELIASCERGLLFNRFSGGEPALNGDFSGVAKNSFLIENGKLAGAVSETMISGNLYAMLRQVRGISKERACNGRTLLPWAAFGGVTISGG